ncbi:MAG TPA: NAD(P)H nitroreductase [Spirochaetia bacterium]|nr:NAD(P)H nitroreductase [Spirochaetia bacterium]
MNHHEIFSLRRSVRNYLDKPIPREMLVACAEAARIAPSACNSQPWEFIIADNPGIVKKLADASFGPLIKFNKFVPGAKAIAAVITKRPNIISQIGGFLKKREFNLLDTGMACENFCLQAAALGLGTCMLGWFDEKTVKKILSIPPDRRIALLISIGFPADTPSEKKRKSLEEMCRFNKY